MLKILFVCHGNICRSPMAEFVIRQMLEQRGIDNVLTESAGTSSEELGNPVHSGTARILRRLGIDYSGKRARQITKSDYDEFDLIIGLDSANIRNMERFWGDPQNKIRRLLLDRDVADPWYTGDFERTYADIREGCEKLVTTVMERIQ
ncbi:MAG: low molecular weight phosphotyrosine protein phosphatase [Ruminococcaceae bacterium]|nr:low molecular weight phosphotyrosine protein phosphatase [Oscillospiraceae bacterium]